MSTNKLTLSISDALVEKAKKYAKSRGTSISYLVEQFLMQLTKNQLESKVNPSKLSKLKGAINLPDNYNYKDDLANLLKK